MGVIWDTPWELCETYMNSSEFGMKSHKSPLKGVLHLENISKTLVLTCGGFTFVSRSGILALANIGPIIDTCIEQVPSFTAAIALAIACSSQLPRFVFLSCPLGILTENNGSS
jgi:hypothetical protein